MNAKLLLKNLKRAAGKKKGTLLTIACVASTLLAVYEAVKNGPTLKKKYEEKKEETGSTLEGVKAAVFTKEAAEVAIPTATSIASVVALNVTTGETIRNLTDMYTTATTGKEIFEKYAKEEIGEEKVNDIKEKVAKEMAPGGYGTQAFFDKVIPTGHGNYIFYDESLRIWFRSDLQFLRKLKNDYRDIQLNELFISIRDFYLDAGIPQEYLEGLDNRGLNINHKIEFSWDLRATENDEPYYHISWEYPPFDIWEPAHRFM